MTELMRIYDVPEIPDGLNPEEAGKMLENIYGNADKGHPCLCSGHPQFEDFRVAITELFSIKDEQKQSESEETNEQSKKA